MIKNIMKFYSKNSGNICACCLDVMLILAMIAVPASVKLFCNIIS